MEVAAVVWLRWRSVGMVGVAPARQSLIGRGNAGAQERGLSKGQSCDLQITAFSRPTVQIQRDGSRKRDDCANHRSRVIIQETMVVGIGIPLPIAACLYQGVGRWYGGEVKDAVGVCKGTKNMTIQMVEEIGDWNWRKTIRSFLSVAGSGDNQENPEQYGDPAVPNWHLSHHGLGFNNQEEQTRRAFRQDNNDFLKKVSLFFVMHCPVSGSGLIGCDIRISVSSASIFPQQSQKYSPACCRFGR